MWPPEQRVQSMNETSRWKLQEAWDGWCGGGERLAQESGQDCGVVAGTPRVHQLAVGAISGMASVVSAKEGCLAWNHLGSWVL